MTLVATHPFPSTLAGSLAADSSLRESLLNYFIEQSTGQELSEWLRGLDLDPRGTVDDKRARVRANTKYLSMPPDAFPAQTHNYLVNYSSGHLSDICETLGVDSTGDREIKWRRIMREVAYREGWLRRHPTLSAESVNLEVVRPLVEWHLIPRRGQYEKDFYPGFRSDMEEILGEGLVHEQRPIASGSVLRIDFHLGHPQREGVGVEFKMPANNSDVQRALGQIEQYAEHYQGRMLVVLIPDLMKKSEIIQFTDSVTAKGIPVVTK